MRGAWLAAAAAAWLVGCAQLPTAGPVPADLRSGRLALTVPDQPGQSLAAGFELRGRPEAGELLLLSPIGGQLAQLRWQPGAAALATPGRPVQQFDSLEAMLQQATGAPLPVAALFDWLDGKPTSVPGWEVDLSQLDQGRLRAQRREPPPAADLRVVLDR